MVFSYIWSTLLRRLLLDRPPRYKYVGSILFSVMYRSIMLMVSCIRIGIPWLMVYTCLLTVIIITYICIVSLWLIPFSSETIEFPVHFVYSLSEDVSFIGDTRNTEHTSLVTYLTSIHRLPSSLPIYYQSLQSSSSSSTSSFFSSVLEKGVHYRLSLSLTAYDVRDDSCSLLSVKKKEYRYPSSNIVVQINDNNNIPSSSYPSYPHHPHLLTIHTDVIGKIVSPSIDVPSESSSFLSLLPNFTLLSQNSHTWFIKYPLSDVVPLSFVDNLLYLIPKVVFFPFWIMYRAVQWLWRIIFLSSHDDDDKYDHRYKSFTHTIPHLSNYYEPLTSNYQAYGILIRLTNNPSIVIEQGMLKFHRQLTWIQYTLFHYYYLIMVIVSNIVTIGLLVIGYGIYLLSRYYSKQSSTAITTGLEPSVTLYNHLKNTTRTSVLPPAVHSISVSNNYSLHRRMSNDEIVKEYKSTRDSTYLCSSDGTEEEKEEEPYRPLSPNPMSSLVPIQSQQLSCVTDIFIQAINNSHRILHSSYTVREEDGHTIRDVTEYTNPNDNNNNVRSDRYSGKEKQSDDRNFWNGNGDNKNIQDTVIDTDTDDIEDNEEEDITITTLSQELPIPGLLRQRRSITH